MKFRVYCIKWCHVDRSYTKPSLFCYCGMSGHEPPIVEWEYLPHIGPRPPKGFVGLKNAGATCYMNSVLQQLYMIAPIRNRVLQVEEPARDLILQLEDEEKKEKEKEKEANRKNKEEVSLMA